MNHKNEGKNNQKGIAMKYFKIIGKADNKPKKIGIRALSKPTISEAKEISNSKEEYNWKI